MIKLGHACFDEDDCQGNASSSTKGANAVILLSPALGLIFGRIPGGPICSSN